MQRIVSGDYVAFQTERPTSCTILCSDMPAKLAPWSKMPVQQPIPVSDTSKEPFNFTCGCTGHPTPDIHWECSARTIPTTWQQCGQVRGYLRDWSGWRVHANLTMVVIDLPASLALQFRCVCKNSHGEPAISDAAIPLRIIHPFALFYLTLHTFDDIIPS